MKSKESHHNAMALNCLAMIFIIVAIVQNLLVMQRIAQLLILGWKVGWDDIDITTGSFMLKLFTGASVVLVLFAIFLRNKLANNKFFMISMNASISMLSMGFIVWWGMILSPYVNVILR